MIERKPVDHIADLQPKNKMLRIIERIKREREEAERS